MDIQEYSKLALRTANDLGPQGDLIHAALGIASEGGEIADVVKATVAYGRPLDTPHLLEELGDLTWFMNLMIQTLGLTWGQVFASNIAKLEARYPNLRFEDDKALNRDKLAEQEAIRNA